MPIRQADAPNQCSSANKAVYSTFMVLGTPAFPFGCSATLRSLSHCLQLIRHSSRQLLCPSCHLIHFVLRFASLHHVRSPTICCKAWQPDLNHKAELQGCTNPFANHPIILTRFHFATLRPSFISVAFSPPAANNFARLAACPGYGFVMVFVRPHKATRQKQKHTPNPCVSLLLSDAASLLFQPAPVQALAAAYVLLRRL